MSSLAQAVCGKVNFLAKGFSMSEAKIPMMTDLTSLAAKQREVIMKVLAHAKALGSSEAAAEIHFTEGFDADVRMGEVDKMNFRRDQGLSVSLFHGKQRGMATSTDLSEASIKDTVEKAWSMANFCEADLANGLPDKARQAFHYPDLHLHKPWDVTPAQAIDMAKAAEAHGLDYDKRIVNSEGASVNTTEAIFTYGDSNGFLGSYPSSMHSLSVCLIAEQEGQMERDYEYAASRDPKKLGDFNTIAKLAAEKTVKRLQPKKIKTGQYKVILLPEVARGFWSHLISALSGSQLYKRMSFLVDSLGQAVLPPHLSLLEQPHIAGAIGSAPFDAEGVATEEQMLIQDGIVSRYILGSYSARKLGMVTTGNAGGIHNLIIQSQTPEPSLQELIEEMQDGIIVTDVMGQGINLVTGDYSRGATGFLVQRGKIMHPVSEITIAGQLRELYQDIIAVANDVDKRGVIQSGSMLLKQMTVASAG